VSTRPRILILDGPAPAAGPLQLPSPLDAEIVRAATLAEGLELLRRERFEGVYANTQDPAVYAWTANVLQTDRVFNALPESVAVLNPNLEILWANAAFDQWCGGPTKGGGFYDALDSPENLGPDYSPFHTALAGKATETRLHCRDNRYLEVHFTPVHESDGQVYQIISMGRDVTAEVNQQQKLNALHQAGRELAALSADQLADMGVEERVEMLKLNIRKLTHDLLHYDVIEIRLLDRQTGRLEPLLAEGMTEEARRRVLYARAEGNGVTGYVAATGKSYLCPDTAADPLYLKGATDAHSSLTVPLIFQDQVIGTFNVESPQLDAFGDADLQFAEIFSREIASALHTLELLLAEKRSTASQSIEAISREVALPVDEILTAATAVLDRYIGHEPEMAEKLRHILASARSLKQCIQRVGEDMAPPPSAPRPGEQAHARLRGLRVLVADNDERVRRSAHGILGRFGCVVETARDGQEALTMARLSTYDVILADIRLPDLTGYDVYHRLRQAQPVAQVILMTSYGYDPDHSILKARQEGLRYVLYKPFRIDQLLESLENVDGPRSTPCPAPQTARVKA
jgi:CheY-like chemotaxis protein